MNFKFLRGGEESMGNILTFHQPRFQNNVEFCFQFDDGEPTVFGNGPNDLHIHITPNGNITFTSNNGQTFKIFARERQ